MSKSYPNIVRRIIFDFLSRSLVETKVNKDKEL